MNFDWLWLSGITFNRHSRQPNLQDSLVSCMQRIKLTRTWNKQIFWGPGFPLRSYLYPNYLDSNESLTHNNSCFSNEWKAPIRLCIPVLNFVKYPWTHLQIDKTLLKGSFNSMAAKFLNCFHRMEGDITISPCPAVSDRATKKPWKWLEQKGTFWYNGQCKATAHTEAQDTKGGWTCMPA